MKKRKIYTFLAMTMAAAILVTGCGSSTSGDTDVTDNAAVEEDENFDEPAIREMLAGTWRESVVHYPGEDPVAAEYEAGVTFNDDIHCHFTVVDKTKGYPNDGTFSERMAWLTEQGESMDTPETTYYIEPKTKADFDDGSHIYMINVNIEPINEVDGKSLGLDKFFIYDTAKDVLYNGKMPDDFYFNFISEGGTTREEWDAVVAASDFYTELVRQEAQ